MCQYGFALCRFRTVWANLVRGAKRVGHDACEILGMDRVHEKDRAAVCARVR
ncbi:MAG: hypothetical protein JWM99_4297 [Verrucomicrobiales bacterium]|nr:hypothetical protein [Verrucomicrobiales bacterium]